ncbi:MAG: HEAT repeat domain-containing protein [Polyangiaceae bacterium]
MDDCTPSARPVSRRFRSLRAALVTAVVVTSSSSSPEAEAAPPTKAQVPAAKPSAAGKGAADLAPSVPADVAERLESGDPAKVLSALDDVRLAGDVRATGKAGAAAVKAVIDALDRGLPPRIAVSALDTLAEIANTTGGDAIAPYGMHRSKEVRVAAVRALAFAKSTQATRVLRRALADSDAAVRAAAATSVGAAKVKDAMPELVLALDHRVNDAAVAIGQVCTDTNCDVLLGRLGRLPFDVVTSGLAEALLRPASKSATTPRSLVNKVASLNTNEARLFLKDVAKKSPPGASAKLKAALEEGGKGV